MYVIQSTILDSVIYSDRLKNAWCTISRLNLTGRITILFKYIMSDVVILQKGKSGDLQTAS